MLDRGLAEGLARAVFRPLTPRRLPPDRMRRLRGAGLVSGVLGLLTRRASSLPGSDGLLPPQWSPDRRFIAALTKDSRKLLLFDLATETWKDLVNGQLVSYPAWSRNGKYIYFCNPMGNVVRFYRVGVENLKLEDVASVNLPRGLASGMFGSWTGLAPDDSPLLVRDTSIQEIYALDLQLP